jgi:hypothetical protein
MTTTTLRSDTTINKGRIASPYQQIKQDAEEMTNKNVWDEMRRCIGTYNLSAVFEEDTQTIGTFKHIPGIVAFICTIKKGDKIIGQGRGTAVINKVNKYIERTVRASFNAALIDGIVKSTKFLDAIYPDANPDSQDMGVAFRQAYGFDAITDKQKSYLLGLIQSIDDEEERNRWESQVDGLTKEDANDAIKAFKR